MDFGTGVMVYFLIWWVVIFAVLPFKVVRNTDEHQGSGAPAKPYIKEKFLITTGISFLVWLLVYVLVNANFINFRELSMQMIQEDYKNEKY